MLQIFNATGLEVLGAKVRARAELLCFALLCFALLCFAVL
jgi:hypothetical protein